MSDYGISTDLQQVIMDPAFKYIRLSESCAYWVSDTVRMRYAELEDAIERDIPLPFDNRPFYSHDPTFTAPWIDTDDTDSSIASKLRFACSRTMLYKTIDRARIPDLFHDDGELDDIGCLQTSSPFSRREKPITFTTDYDVARLYAAYAKHRAANADICILYFSVPNPITDHIDAQYLHWPSRQWKEFIWLNRTSNHQPMPETLQQYDEATLIIGSMSRLPNSEYRRMQSWEDIGENHVCKRGTNTVTEYVFLTDAGHAFLESCMPGNIRVFRVFGLRSEDVILTSIEGADA